MLFECKCCGKEYEVKKGNHKYCYNCRAEIDERVMYEGGFKKAVKVVMDKHKEEREKERERKAVMRVVNANKMTLDEVVHRALVNGRSYGHEVAVMEGREY